ncbi:MAG: hypothetical protein Ct9H90mP10_08450 [Actinomycetota bacterium]|nr:MAG: hypothetical protein Ct9H90mP10_08450 [Actinomycetota bacterium]
MVTETGAGQWGSALSFACQAFGIDLEVFQVALLCLNPKKDNDGNLWCNVHPSPLKEQILENNSYLRIQKTLEA